MSDNNLMIAFTDQSNSFTHGVEFGRIWNRMEQGAETVSNNGFPVRIENKKVLQDACTAYGYVGVFGDEIYGWCTFIAFKKTSVNDN